MHGLLPRFLLVPKLKTGGHQIPQVGPQEGDKRCSNLKSLPTNKLACSDPPSISLQPPAAFSLGRTSGWNMDLSPGPPAAHHTMDESSWTPMQFEGGRPLVMSGDGVRDWFNGELDRLEKRRERGIFSAAQVNQPPPRLRTPETRKPRNPEIPKPRNPEAPQ